MNNDAFEGYAGTYLNNNVLSNDILLIVVLVLLSTFALIFRLNVPMFSRMIGNISAGEKGQSIFDAIAKDSFLLNLFMGFQAIFLCSVFLFSIAVKNEFFVRPGVMIAFLIVIFLFIIILLFCALKRAIYHSFGHVFAEKLLCKMMLMNYQALFCLWGVFLYIPVLWVLFVGKYIFVAYTFFIISYIAFRAALIYRFVYIFFNKNTGLLFLSLYLCAQEIIPLVFLYEGLIYMYNIIEISNIWQ